MYLDSAPLLYQQTYGTADPVAGDAALHGGKGAGLLDMTLAGLQVPEALILTTNSWKFFRTNGFLPTQVIDAVAAHLDTFHTSMFSVRSGAPVSMPGMMDTVLNMGVTPELDAAYPGAYRRFAAAWLGIVKGIEKDRITEILGMVRDRAKWQADEKGTLQPVDDPARERALLSAVIASSEGIAVPDTRLEQAMACVRAVFQSWDTPRAKAYRSMHGIDENMGTACVIQRMVMGTAPGLSGSGVVFSRNPATGEPIMKGEIAFNAQGEEVVAGEITPTSLDDLAHSGNSDHEHLHSQLVSLCGNLEHHFKDVQDIEFTVESGNLYVLQTRTAKMSARARIETACALAQELHSSSIQDQLDYLKARVTRQMLAQTMVPQIDTDSAPLATGLAASPGALAGTVVFRKTPLSQINKNSILVAEDTTPEDFPIMAKCGGILTKTGGFTCHSAVVARGIGVPAVVGCAEVAFGAKGAATVANSGLKEGDPITIDGGTGRVYLGALKVTKQQPPRILYSTLHSMVQESSKHMDPPPAYYDCGLGDRVVLPLNPVDTERFETQIARAHRLKAKGKTVGFGFEYQANTEDMFPAGPESIFGPMIDNYGPDLAGFPILYGLTQDAADYLTSKLDIQINLKDDIQILDLLDLLEKT